MHIHCMKMAQYICTTYRNTADLGQRKPLAPGQILPGVEKVMTTQNNWKHFCSLKVSAGLIPRFTQLAVGKKTNKKKKLTSSEKSWAKAWK